MNHDQQEYDKQLIERLSGKADQQEYNAAYDAMLKRLREGDMPAPAPEVNMSGLKLDDQKLDWHAFPMDALEGLIRVAMAGCDKYERFNCLKPFVDGDRRFFSAAMRHAVACQIDPLAVDEETGCRHGYQSAWNLIMRTYHAEQREGKL